MSLSGRVLVCCTHALPVYRAPSYSGQKSAQCTARWNRRHILLHSASDITRSWISQRCNLAALPCVLAAQCVAAVCLPRLQAVCGVCTASRVRWAQARYSLALHHVWTVTEGQLTTGEPTEEIPAHTHTHTHTHTRFDTATRTHRRTYP